MTVHTQIWSECTQCGWSQGIDIHVISASIDSPDPAAMPTLTVEAYFGDGVKRVSQVASLVHRHVCPKSHDECLPPSRALGSTTDKSGCRHGSLDCPAARIPAVYEASTPIIKLTHS